MQMKILEECDEEIEELKRYTLPDSQTKEEKSAQKEEKNAPKEEEKKKEPILNQLIKKQFQFSKS